MDLRDGDFSATVSAQTLELTSLRLTGVEFVHGGGKTATEKTALDKTGWQHSEIVIYPTVGPCPQGALLALGHKASLGSHGIARHGVWNERAHDSRTAHLAFQYLPHEPLLNTKSPPLPATEPRALSWPYAFTITQTYTIARHALHVIFTINNDDKRAQPYRFGWQQAFRTDEHTKIVVRDGAKVVKTLSMKQIEEASKGTHGFVVEHAEIELRRRDGSVFVRHDFGKTALWRPGEVPMVCIEPITHAADNAAELTSANAHILQPAAHATYHVRIELSAPLPAASAGLPATVQKIPLQ